MADDSSALGTVRRFAYNISTTAYRGYWGVRLMGVIALTFDGLLSAIQYAVTSPYISMDIGPAHDALALIGDEMSMPRYDTESWLDYRERLRAGWIIWAEAASTNSIINQLAAAGYPGAEVESAHNPSNWSDFVVNFPLGTHLVTSPGIKFQSLVYGSGATYGPVGLDRAVAKKQRDVILHWKPAHWKCSEIRYFTDAGRTEYGSHKVQ